MTHQFCGGLPPHFWRLHFCKCLQWWKILNRLNSWFLDASFLGVNSVLLYTLLWKDLFATQRLPKHKAHENGEWCGISMFLLLNQKRTSIFESAEIKAMGTNQGLLSFTNKHPWFYQVLKFLWLLLDTVLHFFQSHQVSPAGDSVLYDHVICSSRLQL